VVSLRGDLGQDSPSYPRPSIDPNADGEMLTQSTR
jgi:hypothetical protein